MLVTAGPSGPPGCSAALWLTYWLSMTMTAMPWPAWPVPAREDLTFAKRHVEGNSAFPGVGARCWISGPEGPLMSGVVLILAVHGQLCWSRTIYPCPYCSWATVLVMNHAPPTSLPVIHPEVYWIELWTIVIQTGMGAVIKLNMIESAEVRTFGHINSTELWPRVWCV